MGVGGWGLRGMVGKIMVVGPLRLRRRSAHMSSQAGMAVEEIAVLYDDSRIGDRLSSSGHMLPADLLTF